MNGQVVAVCLGPGGIPKQPVDQAEVGALGLHGDGHRHPEHGGENRAVCLYSVGDYRSMVRDGVSGTAPGSFGENLLIDGMDFGQLTPGDRLAVGDQVILEIHDCREPCITLQSVDSRFPALMEGRSGFLCKTERGGWVHPGDRVSRLA
ncbi:MAG: MOSC domain-containing protein [Planctomycetes bacterium]|nr:MOSC domain-containing protein [Planctomycetota bacterium]